MMSQQEYWKMKVTLEEVQRAIKCLKANKIPVLMVSLY